LPFKFNLQRYSVEELTEVGGLYKLNPADPCSL
jgi:hypothetical protein